MECRGFKILPDLESIESRLSNPGKSLFLEHSQAELLGLKTSDICSLIIAYCLSIGLNYIKELYNDSFFYII